MIDPSGDQTRLPPDHREALLAQLRKDPEEEIRWYFQQLLPGAQPAVRDRVLRDLEEVAPEIVIGAIEGATAYSPIEALERFGGPAVSVISDLNTLPSSLHHLVPSLPVRHLSGASHWLMLDRPAETWAALVDLLDEIEGRLGSPGCSGE